ncbi:hypothetical protein G7054_g11130 [Neopestalotiopsis clavispora]|nr:hypothetical protein G7054_g11130 [Neopestalotiopsis clavispora]
MISDYILENAAADLSTLDENVEFRYSSFEDIVAPRPLSCVLLMTNPGLRIEMNVWSDPESPAGLSGAVCTKSPLPSDSCSAAFKHINSWLQDCLQNHEECKFTIARNPVDEIHGPKLPTRVLDLECADSTGLSLIEARDKRGRYCALSYCWGPPGMNPLLTTRANISSRFDGIDFEKLPKTLQDAVIVTRKIGIRYLWIDSLCIIQGDNSDWTTESAKMTEVYQNAYLVIAASGAAHPGEGCFSNKTSMLNLGRDSIFLRGPPDDGIYSTLNAPLREEKPCLWATSG